MRLKNGIPGLRLSILRQRDFRLLWAGSTISDFGSWLLVIAAPVQAYRLTGSSLAVGLVLVIEAAPALLVGPWAGVLADRCSRKVIMIAADLVSAAGVTLILAAAAGRVAFIYAGLLAENLAVAFFRPAARAVLPAVVGTGDDLAAANSLSALTGSCARLLVPPLGALLLSAAGLRAVVGIDAASYLASAALTAAIAGSVAGSAARAPGGAGPASGQRHAAGQLLDGLRYLAAAPLLRGLLITSWAYWTANAAGTVLLVPFVVHRLGGHGQDIGYLIAGLGAGYLVGSAAARQLIRRWPTRGLLVFAYSAVGAGLLAMFNAPSLPAAVAAAALAGIPGAVAMVVTRWAVQAAAPQPVLGRVGAAFFASDSAAAIAGALAAPAVAAAAGLPAALDLVGGAVIVAAAAVLVLLPAGQAAALPARPAESGAGAG